MTKRKNIIPIFIPHQGCKHDCIFCNQRHITKSDGLIVDIAGQIEKHLPYFRDKSNIEIAFYGGSFTGINRNLMLSYLDEVKPFIDTNIVKSIRISTRPDYISTEILNLLKSYQVEAIELGVQSMDDRILAMNNRGTNRKQIQEASRLIKQSGFNLGLQMMTGLFRSNDNTDLNTAFELARLNPDFVRIYPTMVLPDTHLFKLYRSGDYKPSKLDATIVLLEKLVVTFESNDIEIIRIGLHSDGKDGEDMVDGPFHPALKQVVYSNLYSEMINLNVNLNEGEHIAFYANKKDLNYLVGFNAINKVNLLNKNIIATYHTVDIAENSIIAETSSEKSTLDFRSFCRTKVGEINEA